MNDKKSKLIVGTSLTLAFLGFMFIFLKRKDKKTSKPRQLEISKSTESAEVRERVSFGSNARETEMKTLVKILDTRDEAMLEKVLVTIGNAAAFTQNQETLRESGCLEKLTAVLQQYRMDTNFEMSPGRQRIITSLTKAINNLAMNELNQETLKECIPILIEFASSEQSPESIQLASLQALTNLSVTSKFHLPYTQVIQQLYRLLDTGSNSLKLQSLKILSNLSCNGAMIPHLLAARAPRSTLELLSPECAPDLLLRWTSVLANITEVAKKTRMTPHSLPCEYKAASPETLYSTLYGIDSKVKSKVYRLTRLEIEDVKEYAMRIHAAL